MNGPGCRKRPALVGVVCLTAILPLTLGELAYGGGSAQGGSDGPSRRSRSSASDFSSDPREIEAKLEKRLQEINFDNRPLRECVDWIGTRIGVVIRLDREALEDVGVTPEHPVTLRLRYAAVKARRLLELVVHPLGLTYVIHDGVISVTPPPCSWLELRMYGCRDLVVDKIDKASSLVDRPRLIALVRLIQNYTSGPWEDIDGVGGWIEYVDEVLVIMQSQRVHREIAELLERIREAKARRNGRSVRPASVLGR